MGGAIRLCTAFGAPPHSTALADTDSRARLYFTRVHRSTMTKVKYSYSCLDMSRQHPSCSFTVINKKQLLTRPSPI